MLTGISKAWVGNSSNIPIELSNPDNANNNLFTNIKKIVLSDITNTNKVPDSSADNNFRYTLKINNTVSVNLIYGLISSYYRIDHPFSNYHGYSASQLWIGTGSFSMIFRGSDESGYSMIPSETSLEYDSDKNIFTIKNFISESSIPRMFTLFYV